MANTTKTQSTGSVDVVSVFAYLNEQQHSALTQQIAEVDQTMKAIRELEQITRELDAPFIGSFLTS